MGDPRRERPPAVYGHVINAPTQFNVKLPAIDGHLPKGSFTIIDIYESVQRVGFLPTPSRLPQSVL